MIENFRHWALNFISWLRRRPHRPPVASEGISPRQPPLARPSEADISADHADQPTPVEVETPLAEAIKAELFKQASAAKRTSARRARQKNMRLKQSILDQLDDNTKILGRMKTFFPIEYGLYSQVGAVIVPHEDPFICTSELITEPVSPWFNKARPAFGAVVTGDPHDHTKGKGHILSARITHFLKIEGPKDMHRQMFRRGHPAMQPIASSSDLYIFTLYYDERDWAKLFPKKSRDDWKLAKFYERAFAIELPIELTKDGCARPLKIQRDRFLDCPRSKQAGYSDVRRTVKKWDYQFTKEFIAALKTDFQFTPETYILMEIGLCLRCFEEANASMIQVRAAKNDICTLINVNVEDTPDFFNDREDVIVDGVKKRIFHIVRPHERVVRNKTALVHLHFRGLRQFVWNGYAIEISVPGRDHFDINDFNCTAIDDDDGKRKGHTLDKVGGWLVANQRARWGAMVGKPGKVIRLRDYPPQPHNPG
jgi:hypothetical protein